MISPEEFARRPAHRRVGLYLIGLVAVGGGGGIVIFIALMQMLGWSLGSFLSSSPMAGSSATQIVLLRSPTTERYFTSVQGSYDVLLKPWRNYAKSSGVALSEIDNVEKLKPRNGLVLIVPSALALTDAEKLNILKFREAGGDILLTWATGTRTSTGEWSGWGFLNQISGFQLAAELPADGSFDHLVTLGQDATTHVLEAGTRISLGRINERPIVFKGGMVGAQASSASRQTRTDLKEGVLMYQEFSTPLPSRVAVLGIAETAWEYQLNDTHALISGVLGWLAHQPALFPSHWPEGKRAAYVIAMDAEDQMQQAQHWVQQMAEKRYMGSVFFTSALANQFPDTLQQMASQANLGYGGDIAQEGFKDKDTSQQKQRINKMVQETAAALKQNKVLQGFRAPMNSYDTQTQQLLYEAGVRYQLVDGQDHKSRLPFFATVKGETAGQRFVLLPSTLQNSEQMLADGINDPVLLGKKLINDFLVIYRQGGLGVLILQSRLYGTDGVLEKTIPSFIEQIQSQSHQVWISDAASVAKWWTDRERLRLKPRFLGERIEFDMTILGDAPYPHPTLIVVLPTKEKLPEIRGLKSGMPDPKIDLIDPYRAIIKFDTLESGDYSYQLTF